MFEKGKSNEMDMVLHLPHIPLAESNKNRAMQKGPDNFWFFRHTNCEEKRERSGVGEGEEWKVNNNK